MEKIKFSFDDEITLNNATIDEILKHTATGDTVLVQYNEQLFDELKSYMVDKYKQAYEEMKQDMQGFEIAIWKEETGLKFEW